MGWADSDLGLDTDIVNKMNVIFRFKLDLDLNFRTRTR